MLIALFLLSVACGVICYFVAMKRGARKSYWFLMGLLAGPFAIPFVFFSKSVADK